MQLRSATRRSSGGMAEDDQACWICLEGASAERGPLARPCACPRDAHLKCLSRWQLQNAGRSEERTCRFCKNELPDWKTVLTGPPLPPADPIMVVTLGNEVHKIRVKPGPEGQREFQREIRSLFSIPDGVDFEVTFRCKAPCTTDTIQLEGMSSYDAATHCASLMAAQRIAASSRAPAAPTQQAGSTAPSAPATHSQEQEAEQPARRPSDNGSRQVRRKTGQTMATAAANAIRRMQSAICTAFQGNGNSQVPGGQSSQAQQQQAPFGTELIDMQGSSTLQGMPISHPFPYAPAGVPQQQPFQMTDMASNAMDISNDYMGQQGAELLQGGSSCGDDTVLTTRSSRQGCAGSVCSGLMVDESSGDDDMQMDESDVCADDVAAMQGCDNNKLQGPMCNEAAAKSARMLTNTRRRSPRNHQLGMWTETADALR